MSALNANAHHFSVQSNVHRIVIIVLAICCQSAALFLTTSKTDGIAMISSRLAMASKPRLTTSVGMLAIFGT
jgi:hypothetical protein